MDEDSFIPNGSCSSKMGLADPLQTDSEALLVPKSEPIDTSFIKSEEFEEEQFVIPGIIESDKSVVKEEKIESDDSLEAAPLSSTVSQYLGINVCFSLFINNLI